MCKTEAAQKAVPLDAWMSEELLLWKQQTEYIQPTDWIFASPATEGRFPLWPHMVMRSHIRPLAQAVGIGKTIGWHTFRHTYATLLKANGEDPKHIQEQLRHSTINVSMNVYTQVVEPEKRRAQSAVLKQMRQAVNK